MKLPRHSCLQQPNDKLCNAGSKCLTDPGLLAVIKQEKTPNLRVMLTPHFTRWSTGKRGERGKWAYRRANNDLWIINLIVGERETFLTHHHLNITPVKNPTVHTISEVWEISSIEYHLLKTSAAAMKIFLWIQWKLVPKKNTHFQKLRHYSVLLALFRAIFQLPQTSLSALIYGNSNQSRDYLRQEITLKGFSLRRCKLIRMGRND